MDWMLAVQYVWGWGLVALVVFGVLWAVANG